MTLHQRATILCNVGKLLLSKAGRKCTAIYVLTMVANGPGVNGAPEAGGDG